MSKGIFYRKYFRMPEVYVSFKEGSERTFYNKQRRIKFGQRKKERNRSSSGQYNF